MTKVSRIDPTEKRRVLIIGRDDGTFTFVVENFVRNRSSKDGDRRLGAYRYPSVKNMKKPQAGRGTTHSRSETRPSRLCES